MMTPDSVVGIDLGTTNSVVAHVDEAGIARALATPEGDRIVASAVYFPEGAEPIVGTLARDQAILYPDRVAQFFKRGMGETTFLDDESDFVVDEKKWAPEELSALVLKKLMRTAEGSLSSNVGQAVITVPAYFGEASRQATRDAGEMAGLEVLRIVNEPTAAAIAHGVEAAGEPGPVLVFDLGGGTFDVTVMGVGSAGEIEVLETGGDHRLGGVDFDNLIIAEMARAVEAELGESLEGNPGDLASARQAAEEIKKTLSTVPSASKMIQASGKAMTFTLTRDRFDELLADYLLGVEDHVIHTIEKAGLDPSDFVTALMVGGSSRIPAFQNKLATLLGQDPKLTRNLDEDVARGAAMLAAKLTNTVAAESFLARMPKPVDVCSQALGVTIMDTPTGRLQNSVLVPQGTPIPVTKEEIFGAVSDGQTVIEVELNEGATADLDIVTKLGSSIGQFGRPVPQGYPIRVTIDVTEEQLIRVHAFDGESGGLLCEMTVEHKGLISQQEKAETMRRLEEMALD